MSILARTPARCAGALNLFVGAFCLQVPFALATSQLHGLHDIDVAGSLGLAGLVVYLAYQSGWPVLLLLLLAFGLMGPWYVSLLAGPLVLLVLIQSRLFLQRNGYWVGLMGARPASGEPSGKSISFRRKMRLAAAMAGVAWFPFLLVWVINPAYNAKFFQPMDGVEPWLGSVLLIAAAGLTAFLYPLSVEFYRLRSRAWGWTTGTQLALTVVVVLTVLLAIASILLLTPAALTMMEQMRAVPSLPESSGPRLP